MPAKPEICLSLSSCLRGEISLFAKTGLNRTAITSWCLGGSYTGEPLI
jgi:hypothetical protein